MVWQAVGVDQAQRSRWVPHEVALIALGFLMPLGSETRPAFLADQRLKAIVAVLVVGTCGLAMVWMRSERPSRPGSRVRAAMWPLSAYVALVTVATVTRDLPAVRYQLFALMPVAVLGFLTAETYRHGAWLDIAYRASVLSLLLAALLGTRQLDLYGTGVARLGGASHPVFLGFESCLVGLVAWQRFRSARRRAAPLFVLALAAYTLVASFSRTALIALTMALAAQFVATRSRNRVFSASVVIVGAVISYQTVLPAALHILRGQQATLTNATGRTDIWQRLVDYNHAWWRGFGFFPLHDAHGPDADLWVINQGLPAENAALNVVLMAGLFGLAAWLWLTLRAFYAVRRSTLGVGLVVVLLAFAATGSGLSGTSFDWWWLLALFSLAELGTSTHGEVTAEADMNVVEVSVSLNRLHRQVDSHGLGVHVERVGL